MSVEDEGAGGETPSSVRDTQFTTDSSDLADWMGRLPDRLLDLPLNRLAIPGSHNSGTYNLNTSLGLGPDANKNLKNFVNISFLGSVTMKILLQWCQCQNLNVEEQLISGIRYFDLRVAFHKKLEKFFLIHTLFGPDVFQFLQAVKDFLCRHTNEVILLDFNHFYDMEIENHLQIVTLLHSVFDDMISLYSDRQEVTLRYLRQRKHQLVVFYHHRLAAETGDFWPNTSITSPWPNTMNAERCLDMLESAVLKRDWEKFHVCQGVLTPDLNAILGNVNGSILLSCARVLNSTFLTRLCRDSLRPFLGMIYIVDFVEEVDYTQAIVDLNT